VNGGSVCGVRVSGESGRLGGWVERVGAGATGGGGAGGDTLGDSGGRGDGGGVCMT
jgi:hypothetical protein